MSEFGLPVLLMGFNRPRHFQRVLNAVAAARPSILYVSLDGPRRGNPLDESARQDMLQALEDLTIGCPVRLRALEKNVGSGGHVSSAIDWLFESEEFGVILEDDCLPSPSFFHYVRHAYDHADERVASIAGFNPFEGAGDDIGVQYLSRFPITWGWATWRHRWRHYRIALGDWRERFSPERLSATGGDLPWFSAFWSRRFDELAGGSRMVWDYQWIYWVWQMGAFSLSPALNLVRNIGFGRDSTHTFFARKAYSREFARVPQEFWTGRYSSQGTAEAGDTYVHTRFYKVGSVWPVTAGARAVGRPVVNRLLR